MQWDDLRYVLAVGRAGSLAGAARSLRTSHVTVFRRVEAIEKDLGVRLFDRKRDGYAPTAVAREILQQAEQVEEQIHALERRAWRRDSEVQGTVRITATDTIAGFILPGILARLQRQHPGLRLELDSSDAPANIAKRDADIAIRHTRAPPEMLIGHRLTPVAYAVYGAPALAARYRRNPDPAAFPWVAPEESSYDFPFIKWLRDHGVAARVGLHCKSWVTLTEAVRAGAGLGVLSCFMGDGRPGLVRLTPPIPELEFQYWVLTHPEMRQVARVATVYAFLREGFAGLRPLFTGAASATTPPRPRPGRRGSRKAGSPAPG